MKATVPIAILSLALLAAPAPGGEPLKPTLNIVDMRLLVSFISTGELVKLQQEFGGGVDLRDIRQSHHKGFSILRTNRETGARTCEIYLPKQLQPREVDDDGTISLGHELLHCMYGNYHR